MAPRPARALLVPLLGALLLAGCGGGGDPSTFAGATDRTCREVAAAVTTLRQGLVRDTGTSEGAALATAIGRYATSVDAAAKRLDAADPPKDDRDFQQQAVQRLRTHAKRMRRAADEARHGKFTRGLAAQLEHAGPAAVPAIPEAVLQDAPACRAAVR